MVGITFRVVLNRKVPQAGKIIKVFILLLRASMGPPVPKMSLLLPRRCFLQAAPCLFMVSPCLQSGNHEAAAAKLAANLMNGSEECESHRVYGLAEEEAAAAAAAAVAEEVATGSSIVSIWMVTATRAGWSSDCQTELGNQNQVESRPIKYACSLAIDPNGDQNFDNLLWGIAGMLLRPGDYGLGRYLAHIFSGWPGLHKQNSSF